LSRESFFYKLHSAFLSGYFWPFRVANEVSIEFSSNHSHPQTVCRLHFALSSTLVLCSHKPQSTQHRRNKLLHYRNVTTTLSQVRHGTQESSSVQAPPANRKLESGVNLNWPSTAAQHARCRDTHTYGPEAIVRLIGCGTRGENVRKSDRYLRQGAAARTGQNGI
jgi:hypothetical protein